MTIERARAEHAAKYGMNLIVPACDYLSMLNELERLRAETAAQEEESTS